MYDRIVLNYQVTNKAMNFINLVHDSNCSMDVIWDYIRLIMKTTAQSLGIIFAYISKGFGQYPKRYPMEKKYSHICLI